MFTDFLLERYFSHPKQIHVFIGPGPKEGQLVLPLPVKQFWEKEKFTTKIKCILLRKWTPRAEIIREAAGEIFAVEVFGSTDDFGDRLYNNINWYYHQDWKVESLTEEDTKKISGLESMTILTRMRLSEQFIDALSLKLALWNIDLCKLTYPMLVKIPVISFHYFLEIDLRFTLNSIRKAKHPFADELAAYLYELLFIQQKIALSLHEFLLMVEHTDKQKKESKMIMSEINAIMKADLIFTYLKASVEKTVLLLGYIHQINNLDGLAKHKQKIASLTTRMPDKVKQLPYYEFIMDFISSDNLDELNKYRSGLLHKRGISDLQPHNYFGEHKTTVPLKQVFQIMHEQHGKNTAVLLATLAILTDELVVRDRPDINPVELIFALDEEFRKNLTEAYNADITQRSTNNPGTIQE